MPICKVSPSVNLPNSITLFRLILTAIFIAVASFDAPWAYTVALVSFIIAAISDWLDGYLARKMNLVTALGKLLDPLADKVLVAAGFVYLSKMNFCPVWVTCLIIAREFMVTGLRQIAVEKGVVIAADRLGKWKTTFQLVFIIGTLTHLAFKTLNPENPLVYFFQFLSSPATYVIPATLWIAVALTLISGYNYIYKNRSLLKNN
ncbi:CDP-diacylglycerol--glycerol-3-phosphate 3-phosphatidyltransferase [Rubritalea squalenifaciens DSM 18772]|uniref:CDP-diacylglycerol--glycerol-3-phosphate 3-phosphatidyltransferase n=1 Tax=Rubritalea squalenifaciens DSM 18772 TaxID=1123071 RepID=A0A1M6IVJ5_9BACT|nr:CDP-diacylglycerol--glycerol-3-phosphate 3-phosphatidyltransferase [Rubritalea squalenifaciens DSM 18772]